MKKIAIIALFFVFGIIGLTGCSPDEQRVVEGTLNRDGLPGYSSFKILSVEHQPEGEPRVIIGDRYE